MVGNKNDLNDKRAVTKDEGEVFSRERGFIFQEVSAKSGSNVNNLFYKEIFEEIARKLNINEGGPESERQDNHSKRSIKIDGRQIKPDDAKEQETKKPSGCKGCK